MQNAMVKTNLDALLKEKGRTAYWLAKEAGLHQSVVSKLRHNQIKAIRLDVIESICQALDCEPGQLIIREKKAVKRR